MSDLEFKPKVGSIIKVMSIAFFLIGIFLTSFPLLNRRLSIIEMTIGMIFILVVLLIVVMVITTKYVFTDEGLRIKTHMSFFMLHEDYLENAVPYSSITDYYETHDMSYSIGFSFDTLRIDYIKTNGRKDSFSISPADKTAFISELGRRTGKQLKTTHSKR